MVVGATPSGKSRLNAEGRNWFLGTGWGGCTRKLFRVAGEVERKRAAGAR